MPISVVFDPPLPSDSPSTFNTKAFTLLGDLNDWSTQANALPGEVATNLTTLLASPPAIGSTTPAAGNFTTVSASSYTASSGYYINASTVLTPGATTQGTQFVSSSILQWACGSGGYSWNNNANIASLMSMTNAGAVTIPGSVGIGRAPTTKLDIFGVNQVVGIIQDPGSAGNSELKITAAGVSNYAALHFGSAGYIYDRTDSGNAICIGPDTVLANATAKFNTVSGVVEFTKGTFGYGTGAGGTVTQATSKSTAVTLNKPSGTITTNNSTLLAGASEVFAVSNSSAGFGDLVLLSVTSVSPNWGDYEVSHQATGSGAFFVKIKNTAAVSRSDAVEIVFALIKGTAS